MTWQPDGWAFRARLGVIVPHAAIGAESELMAMAPAGVSLHATRVYLGAMRAAVQDGVTACTGADDCHVARDTEGTWLFSTTRAADRFTCDDATLKCRAVVRDRAQGEACGDGKICAAGLYCKGWIYNGEGRCAPQIKFGDPDLYIAKPEGIKFAEDRLLEDGSAFFVQWMEDQSQQVLFPEQFANAQPRARS